DLDPPASSATHATVQIVPACPQTKPRCARKAGAGGSARPSAAVGLGAWRAYAECLGESARRRLWLLIMSVTSTYAATRLRGRHREFAVLDDLLSKAQEGTSGVLVLRGEPGIGKTALLDHVASRAKGFRVDRICAVQTEMELPFAGFHLLFGSLLYR